jgi:hypothetical protein
MLGFHFLLLNHHMGILSQGSDIIMRYNSPFMLKNIIKENNIIGINEYNIKDSIFYTKFYKNGQKYKEFYWKNSSIFDTFINDDYLRMDVFGNIIKYNLQTDINKNYKLPLDPIDFICNADYINNRGIIITFFNQLYLFNSTDYLHIDTINKDFLYAKKMKIYYKNDGPLFLIIQFGRGGFLYYKILINKNLEEYYILENTRFQFENIEKFFFFNHKFVIFIDSENYLKFVSINNFKIKFQFKLDQYYSDFNIYKNKIFAFDHILSIWKHIQISDY